MQGADDETIFERAASEGRVELPAPPQRESEPGLLSGFQLSAGSEEVEVGAVMERPISLSTRSLDKNIGFDQCRYGVGRGRLRRREELAGTGDRHDGIVRQLLKESKRHHGASFRGKDAGSVGTDKSEQSACGVDGFVGDGRDAIQEVTDPRFPIALRSYGV